MFAFYCQDKINEIDHDENLDTDTKKTLKNKYGEFFNNNLDGLSTLNQAGNERKFKELIEADYKNNSIKDAKEFINFLKSETCSSFFSTSIIKSTDFKKYCVIYSMLC